MSSSKEINIRKGDKFRETEDIKQNMDYVNQLARGVADRNRAKRARDATSNAETKQNETKQSSYDENYDFLSDFLFFCSNFFLSSPTSHPLPPALKHFFQLLGERRQLIDSLFLV